MLELISDSAVGSATGIAFCFVSALAAVVLYHFIRVRKIQSALKTYSAAINNLPQGICKFDKRKKMVFCNRRYAEMYGLRVGDVFPGITVDEIVELRFKAGSSPKLSREEYLKWRSSLTDADKQKGTVVELANGKITEIRQEATPDGGYVATHEDITHRQLAEREQTVAKEQEKRRSGIEEAITSFRSEIEGLLQDLSGDASSLNSTAVTLSSTSNQMYQASAGAVTISDKGFESATTASAAAEELSASISAISQQLDEAAQLVSGSMSEAETADSKISDLAQSVEHIEDVVKVIQQIAGKTNLLALNATIEAARAGEVGKGFVVVASEVKALAAQTAQATEKVASQITNVRMSAKTAIDAIHNNATRLGEIRECTSAVAVALREQDAATSQILSTLSSASTGAQEIRTTLVEVDQSANATHEAAEHVLSASQRVEHLASQFRLKIQSFLKVAAA